MYLLSLESVPSDMKAHSSVCLHAQQLVSMEGHRAVPRLQAELWQEVGKAPEKGQGLFWSREL